MKRKSGRKIYNSFEDIRVYCNDNVLSNNYKGFYEILNDKKLNLIPILSFASIVLIVLSCITLCYMDETNKSGSLDIHDMNSSLNHNYGNYMGEFSADLSSPQNMDIQKIVGIWYDDNGNEIYTSSNNMNNILLYENTKFRMHIPYDNIIKPAKIKIEVYGVLHEDSIYNKTIDLID